MAAPLLFSTFEVTRQAFHRTALTYAIVNLKPIVPGRTYAPPSLPATPSHHFFFPDVLVCSTRPVPRITDLHTDELAELMHTVQRVGRVVERAYNADGLTIACQVRTVRYTP
jgi:bis(5'-adenosyl)-triphosphatase